MSPNPYRFRTGRIGLLVEGVLLVGIGVAGVLVAMSDASPPPQGAPLLFLHLTVLHAAVLLGTGVLACACAWRRLSAMLFAGFQAAGYTLLFGVGVVAAARHVPTVWGFDYVDAALHAVLAAFGLALGMWLAGQALEGRWWVRRDRARQGRRQSRPD